MASKNSTTNISLLNENKNKKLTCKTPMKKKIHHYPHTSRSTDDMGLSLQNA